MERYCLEDEEETRATERAKMKDPQVKIDVLYKEKSRCRPLFLNFLITVTFPSGYFFFLWHFVSLMRARWLHKCEQPSEARRLSSRKGRRMPWQRNGPTVKVISGKDGRWEGRYTAGHNPETRKLIYKNVLGRTQAEAKNKLKAAIEETKSLDVTKAGKYTVGTWMDEWFENYAKIKARPSPHQTYRGYIDNHIKPNIGEISLEKLTSLELQKLYKKLLTSGRIDRVESKNQAKGLSPKTVRNICQIIALAMKLAKEQRLIAADPTEGCALPKLKRKEMKTLPIEQLASFLRDARNSRIFEMYYVELAARLRRGELLGPKWEGIDFEHGNLWMKQ